MTLPLNLTQFGALSIMLGVIVIGELVAKVTNAKVPSALVSSLLLLVCFWTKLIPTDIAARAGIFTGAADANGNAVPGVVTICMLFLIAHLGTTISLKQMKAQWKTVVITLMGIVAIVAICLTAGAAIFGWQNALAATPSLTGGAVAATIMQQAASALGNQAAAVIAILTMMLQGLVGYPITAICLNKETKRLNGLYTSGNLTADSQAAAAEAAGKKATSSPTFILFKLAVIALISYYLQVLTAGYVSQYVWALLLGFAACELKILEPNALGVAKSDGILLSFLLVYLFGALGACSWDLFKSAAIVSIVLALLSAIGMGVMAFIASKIFKESFVMSFAIIMNAYFGFPINVTLTNEAVAASTKDMDARKAISAVIMPKMLVGGFVSVTIVSVFVAGILVKYL